MPFQRRNKGIIKGGVLALLLFLLAGCAGTASWQWSVVSPFNAQGLRNIAYLSQGFLPTIGVTLLSFAITVVLGLLVALIGFAPTRVLRWINRGYVELFRSIPAPVMLLWVYYGLAISFSLSLTPFYAAALAFGLWGSGFAAEIFRAGIQSVTKDQLESAQAIGLTRLQRIWYVVLPQALQSVLPPLMNQFIQILKISSLASIIGLLELTRRGNELTLLNSRPLEVYTFLAFEYLALIVVASKFARWIEKKIRIESEN